MGKIDKAKEYIGALKVYMGFVLASLVATITGTIKLYLHKDSTTMFWIGVTATVLLALGFAVLVKHLHTKIDKLEEI